MYLDKELLRGGTGGYHTYRIPAVLVDAEDSIYLFCEGRIGSSSDFTSVHMLVLTSTDGGETWSEPKVIWKEGTPADEITIGNPCPVIDRDTGELFLMFTRNNERVFVTRSADSGDTWAEPKEITSQVQLPGWKRYWTGPGHGIQLRNSARAGRLLFPSYHLQGNPDGVDSMNCHVVYSDDHGKTWAVGGSTTIPAGFNRSKLMFRSGWWPQGFLWMGCECMAVELPDGRIYLSVRNQVNYGDSRAFSWSGDSGETWSPLGLHTEIPDPKCQGAVVDLPGGEAGGGEADRGGASRGGAGIHGADDATVYLYTGITKGFPGRGDPRSELTLFLSTDECRTWKNTRVLREGQSGYSDLAVLSDGTVRCFYEAGEESYHDSIRVAAFDTHWM